MAKKIYISGNSFIVQDTITDIIEIEKPAKDIYFNNSLLNDGYISVIQRDGSNSADSSIGKEIALADSLDISNLVFTASTFRSFARLNMGKSSAGGSAGFPSVSTYADLLLLDPQPEVLTIYSVFTLIVLTNNIFTLIMLY